MARREIFVDDLDGKEAEDVQTRRFSIGRTAYTIDLNDSNFEKLLKDFEKYTAVATQEEAPSRAVRPSAPRKTASPARGGDKPYTASQVREWAETDDRFKGKVGPRGRIHKDVLEAYEYAHNLDKS